MTPNDLAAFRAAFSLCEVCVLVDISARTVLLCDSAVRLAQEHLDGFCALATRIYAAHAAPDGSMAILSGPLGSRVFVPSPADPTEILCCAFAPGADLTTVEDMARSAFESAGS